ncbi:hypothetical protein Cassandra_0287 [Pseudomonas phage Cassandra]|uniref:Uncharacterized protein n=1 Tax=Pseudomonas phage vB_PaeM_PA5oct TaxID=2163605 RepID=A0A4Y5JT26_9CAUD|nr:hypothetical protein PQE65_gp024 [Pseudomonas phage vB_PaeM_PA5oct]QCG75908.1 hypothetical protein EST35_0024 [Pseudomonas phage vB_PaeM_PA5oct]WPK38963.1 hypothetical protein Cassandra_0287 [Pseudomonas phage Cassandra]WPK39483.1 hypothetical protein Deiofobo_0286 [Pseudomonas phage Deifobo]WPK40517.1 hypothetical protein Paride_0287 [Pseudomonas phage Paride]
MQDHHFTTLLYMSNRADRIKIFRQPSCLIVYIKSGMLYINKQFLKC